MDAAAHPILEIGLDHLLQRKSYGAKSWYIPSSIMAFVMVNMMDRQMATAKYFNDRKLPWHPLVSRLYFGVIWTIHVLRIMEQAGQLSPSDTAFLSAFLNAHRLESLPIPGPLVPFFNALALSKSTLANFGAVFPNIGTGPHYNTGTGSFAIPDIRRRFFIPNVFALRGEINRVLASDSPSTSGKYFQNIPGIGTYTAASGTGSSATPATADAVLRTTWLTPGVLFRIFCPDTVLNNFRQYSGILEVPAIPANAPTFALSWSGFLGFTTGFEWFSEIKTVMTHYSSFWNKSKNMSSVTLSDLGSSLIVAEMTSAAPGTPEADEYPVQFSITSKFYSAAEKLTDIDSALAVVAQPNFLAASAYDGTNRPGRRTWRHGKFWEREPINFHVDEITVSDEFSQKLVESYFIPRGIAPKVED